MPERPVDCDHPLTGRSDNFKNHSMGPSKNRATNTNSHTAALSGKLQKVIVDLISSEQENDRRNGPVALGINDERSWFNPQPEEENGSFIPTWKRALDLTCIAITFPVWMPVMILIMLWIKLVSPGPVFYRQERVGYKKKPFLLFKFRTMHVNVETRIHENHLEQLIEGDHPMIKLDSCGDPRLIRCGRFLRAAGLDELPQLFNVGRGDMSLVGPRPCTVREFNRYRPYQQARFDAPPGLTGYWQVNGKNKTTFSEMIAMDIYYSKSMSLGFDLQIILKTFPAILTQIIESKFPSFNLAQKPRIAPGRPSLVEYSITK